MCFIIDTKYPEEKIAKKDIVCYKRLEVLYPNGRFSSPHQGKRYKLNILYRSELKPSSYNTIKIGLHSYSCKKRAEHYRAFGEVVTKGIIPKGSRYYYNPIMHEYVSNQIIIREVINN